MCWFRTPITAGCGCPWRESFVWRYRVEDELSVLEDYLRRLNEEAAQIERTIERMKKKQTTTE